MEKPQHGDDMMHDKGADLPLSPAALDFEASCGIFRAYDILKCDEEFQNIDMPDPQADLQPSVDVNSAPVSLVPGATSAAVSAPLLPLHSILDKVLNVNPLISLHSPRASFGNVNQVIINLDTLVPSYLAKYDALWHLAKVLVDDAEPSDKDQDQDVVILDKRPRKGPQEAPC